MKVLIVGGSGYVGTHMAQHLLEQGHQVTVASGGGGAPRGRALRGGRCRQERGSARGR